jgi:hypothetical protein
VSLAKEIPKKVRLSPHRCPTPCKRFEVIMNPHLTEIAYILDRSGSMQPMQEHAVAAFNDFLAAHLTIPAKARAPTRRLAENANSIKKEGKRTIYCASIALIFSCKTSSASAMI